MAIVFVFLLFLFIAFSIFSVSIVRLKKGKTQYLYAEIILLVLYMFSVLYFALLLLFNSSQYHEAIDIFDDGYIPFGGKHIISLFVYYVLFIISLWLIWMKGRKLPPLTFVLAIIFMLIGIVISVVSIVQFSETEVGYGRYKEVAYLFMIFPIMNIVISMLLFLKIFREESETVKQRSYKNKFLNDLNTKIATMYSYPTWVVILLIPVLLLITSILMLFGQDYDSLVKAFTDTATWRLSQKEHPPFLDHKGHYLCTVATCGSPEIVKPIRLGKRYGNTIIVNRQLMVANAFEEMIQTKTPKLHRIIRRNYDKYGYPLSKDITKPFWANITYIVMKPLEWFFIICLYLFWVEPEKLIKKQYTL